MVDDRVSGPLTTRPARHYRSPPQKLDDARCLATLLLDRGEELPGDGPWRRPLPGGQRHVATKRPAARSADPVTDRSRAPRRANLISAPPALSLPAAPA